METNFNSIREEILMGAKLPDAISTKQWEAIKESKNISELMNAVKLDFTIIAYRVLSVDFINKYKTEFNSHSIYANQDVTEGYLLAEGSVSIKASGDSNVMASNHAVVYASDNSFVTACDWAYIEAKGNVTVKSTDCMVLAREKAKIYAKNGTVRASGKSYISAKGFACVIAADEVEVEAQDSSTVHLSGEATVLASGSAFVRSEKQMNVKLKGGAIYCAEYPQEVFKVKGSPLKLKTV